MEFTTNKLRVSRTSPDKTQPFITQLFEHIEELSAGVHNAWWDEKKKQGFHPPRECDKYVQEVDDKFTKICERCQTDMYPYDELPENIKEYGRVTVRSVLNAINKIL